jgi:rRNA small subunit pseudouridine methyltransferase Nep1
MGRPAGTRVPRLQHSNGTKENFRKRSTSDGPAREDAQKRLRSKPYVNTTGIEETRFSVSTDEKAVELYKQTLREASANISQDATEKPGIAIASASAQSDAEDSPNDTGRSAKDSGSSSDSGESDGDVHGSTEEAEVNGAKSVGEAVDVGIQHPGGPHNVHVTVLLENANLELVKQPGSRGGQVLLSSDDHGTLLRKMKRDPNDARPDITHQCLLTLLDSPLNKAGRLTVYIRTKRNVLISVHPQTRIPRTIRRFSGLMAELLQKFKVRGTNGTQPLLQVIRNPITSHLPVGQRRVLCTYNSDNVVDMRDDAKRTVQQAAARRGSNEKGGEEDGGMSEVESGDGGQDEVVNVLYVVGAMAHGKVDVDWTDEAVCISEYPLSAATVCSRITYAYECMTGVL